MEIEKIEERNRSHFSTEKNTLNVKHPGKNR